MHAQTSHSHGSIASGCVGIRKKDAVIISATD